MASWAIPSSRFVLLLPGTKSPVSRVSSSDCPSFLRLLFSVQCKIACLGKRVGGMQLLIRKTRAASSGWRGEFLLDLFFLLLTPNPIFFAFFSQAIYPFTNKPRIFWGHAVTNISCSDPLTYPHAFVGSCVLILGSGNEVTIDDLPMSLATPLQGPQGQVESRIPPPSTGDQGRLQEIQCFGTGSDDGLGPISKPCVPLFTPAFLCSETPLLDTELPFHLWKEVLDVSWTWRKWLISNSWVSSIAKGSLPYHPFPLLPPHFIPLPQLCFPRLLLNYLEGCISGGLHTWATAPPHPTAAGASAWVIAGRLAASAGKLGLTELPLSPSTVHPAKSIESFLP